MEMDYDHEVSWLISEPTIYLMHRFTQPVIVYDFTSPRFTEDHTLSVDEADPMDCV